MCTCVHHECVFLWFVIEFWLHKYTEQMNQSKMQSCNVTATNTRPVNTAMLQIFKEKGSSKCHSKRVFAYGNSIFMGLLFFLKGKEWVLRFAIL